MATINSNAGITDFLCVITQKALAAKEKTTSSYGTFFDLKSKKLNYIIRSFQKYVGSLFNLI